MSVARHVREIAGEPRPDRRWFFLLRRSLCALWALQAILHTGPVRRWTVIRIQAAVTAAWTAFSQPMPVDLNPASPSFLHGA
jgi:hypothetical protein